MVVLNKETIEKILPVSAAADFRCTNLGHIGFVTHHRPEMLVFLSNAKYMDGIQSENIVAVLTTAQLSPEVLKRGKVPIISENPKRDFEVLRDYVARDRYVRTPSTIAPSATVSNRAWISETNVCIGKRCTIEPNVTILDGVEIGDDSFIGAGTVLGTAFDSKLCGNEITKNFHDGKLIVGNNVEIHSNCCLDKGNSFHGDTIIGDYSRVSHLTYIGHSTKVGQYVFIMHRVAIAGGVVIGDRARIDPGSNICSHLNIGAEAIVTTGSTVTQDVPPGIRVSGYFAVPHDEFKRRQAADTRI